MRKILLLFMVFFVFSLSFVHSNVFASEDDIATTPATEINSYELFWPIVAGKVQGDSLYFLKLFKENVRGFLIFSSVKKAEYFSVLSTKRLVEYEELVLVKKDFDNATKTLGNYTKTQKKAIGYLDKASNEGIGTVGASQTIGDTFNKQLSLLNFIIVGVDDSQKPLVENAISYLASVLEKLQ